MFHASLTLLLPRLLVTLHPVKASADQRVSVVFCKEIIFFIIRNCFNTKPDFDNKYFLFDDLPLKTSLNLHAFRPGLLGSMGFYHLLGHSNIKMGTRD